MRMFLETVSGKEVRSDVIVDENGYDLAGEKLEQFRKDTESLFKSFSTLSYIFMTVGGVKRYYNPATVVAAWVR